MKDESENERFLFVYYMECLPFLDEVDETLRCGYLQRATAGSMEKVDSLREESNNRDAVAAGEWLPTTTLQSVFLTVQVVRAGTAAHFNGTERPWSSNLFYVKMLCKESPLKKRRAYEKGLLVYSLRGVER